jgi:hypothetical protein
VLGGPLASNGSALAPLFRLPCVMSQYKTVILPVVFYGCETRFLKLGEEHRLRVLVGMVLRGMSRSKRDDVTGARRHLLLTINSDYFPKQH